MADTSGQPPPAADGAEGMDVDAAEAATPAAPLNLSILETIKVAQSQNGLKHGDYMRYRWVAGWVRGVGGSARALLDTYGSAAATPVLMLITGAVS